MIRKQDNKTGFTLIELSLSIVFIGMLSLTITLIIVNLIVSYRRTLTLKQINGVSTEIIEDIRTAVLDSSTGSIKNFCTINYPNNEEANRNCQLDNGQNFVSISYKAYAYSLDNLSANDSANNIPVFGAFCSGSYSYVWNSGYFFSNDYKVYTTSNRNTEIKPVNIRTSDGNKIIASNFRLLKIYDPGRSICVFATKNADVNNNDYTPDYASAIERYAADSKSYDFRIGLDTKDYVDLIKAEGDNNLAIYNLFVSTPAQDYLAENVYYSGSFLLATTKGNLNITSKSNYCSTSTLSNLDNCAINKFNFAARANGR